MHIDSRLRNTLLALGTAAALTATTGCFASAKTGTAPSADATSTAALQAPSTVQPTGLEVAKGIAEAELGMMAGGDWSGAWELWTATAKQAMSKADFIALNKACPSKLGVLYEIQDVKPVTGLTVTVTWKHADTNGSGTMKYESGSWHYEADAKQLADYRLGTQALIAKRKAAKTCTLGS
jgi:hypothetical protein